MSCPTPRQEITRLWSHRRGESYIRHLIRINIREARLDDSVDQQLTIHNQWKASESCL